MIRSPHRPFSGLSSFQIKKDVACEFEAGINKAAMAANATTPDELPSQPRKASWKRWTLAVACVLAIALAVLLPKALEREPVSVRFIGSTNDSGHRVLYFEGTNGLPKNITYNAQLFATNDYSSQRGGPQQPYDWIALRSVPSGKSFVFALDTPPMQTNWYVRWHFGEQNTNSTRWQKVQFVCYETLARHGMYGLAQVVGGPRHVHIIPATDLKD